MAPPPRFHWQLLTFFSGFPVRHVSEGKSISWGSAVEDSFCNLVLDGPHQRALRAKSVLEVGIVTTKPRAHPTQQTPLAVPPHTLPSWCVRRPKKLRNSGLGRRRRKKFFFASEKVERPTILLFSHSVSTSPSSKSYHGGWILMPEYVRVCVFVGEIA